MMKDSFRSSGHSDSRTITVCLRHQLSCVWGVLLALGMWLAGAIGVLGTTAAAWADPTGGEEGEQAAPPPPPPPTCPNWLEEEIPENWTTIYHGASREPSRSFTSADPIDVYCQSQNLTTKLVEGRAGGHSTGGVHQAWSTVWVPQLKCSEYNSIGRRTATKDYSDAATPSFVDGGFSSIQMWSAARSQMERWLLYCPPPPLIHCPCPEVNSWYVASVSGEVRAAGSAFINRKGSGAKVQNRVRIHFFGVINHNLQVNIQESVTNNDWDSVGLTIPPTIGFTITESDTQWHNWDRDDEFERQVLEFGCADRKSQSANTLARSRATSLNGATYVTSASVANVDELSLNGEWGPPWCEDEGQALHKDTMDALLGLGMPPCDAALLMAELVPMPTPIDLDRYARGLNEDDRQIFFQCLDRDRLGLIKPPAMDQDGGLDGLRRD